MEHSRRVLLRIACASLVLTLAACAATRAPPDDTDLRLQAASHAFGGRYTYLVIRSAGALADGAFLKLGGIGGASQMARDLATRMAPAEHSAVRILVTGPEPEKTLRVIRDAFAFLTPGRLPQLEFLFLGEPGQEAEVRALVEAVGGRMRFAAFEG